MLEQKIYHTYKIGNKTKKITTLAGLKRFCTVNTDNNLSFLQLLEKNEFTFHHTIAGEISKNCRLCNNELSVAKIDQQQKKVLLVLCPCSVSSPLTINRGRFLSVLAEEKVDDAYAEYCKHKMRKWTTAGIAVASLDFKINKFGEEEGKKKYKAACKKMDTVSTKFFLSKGYSEKDAAILSKQRQTTFTKQKCIAKFGEEEGNKIWLQRQKKWQDTLNNKPHDEIERINQDKIWKSGTVSKISQQLFEQISIPGARWGKRRDGNDGEKLIVADNLKFMVDFLLDNKIIEFFGDYWHANPKNSPPDKVFNMPGGIRTAQQIWEKDAIRLSAMKKAGYDIMIVWESDYIENPKKVITKCQKFLNK